MALKSDEIFSYQEGINEIDFYTYSQIYTNYEFSINENEFLFYESQIKELNKEYVKEKKDIIENKEKKNELKENENVFSLEKKIQKDKNLFGLSSKYFKKGTLIWIVKKLDENVFQPLFSKSYKSFI